MTEIYKIPEGKITIVFSDKNKSIGLLELNPGQQLLKHNRPVNEELTQIYGSSTIKLFDDGGIIKETILGEGEKLIIPANQFHTHTNFSKERSITLWKFEGDIVEIIEKIKNSFKKL